tara:strand:+ start:1129 stop:2070 length:942 start_codon:yes stop_codon:yes gene_type:complete
MKICVIGGGGWGKNHINTLNKLGVLHGIVDSDKNTLDQFKNINEQCLFFESIDLSLTTNFDGYIIATPAQTHYDIAKKLLNLSKNILVEKPVCLTFDNAKELYEIAKNKKCFIMGGHLLLFHPAFLKMKELVENGKLGKIVYLYSNRVNFGKIRNHENALWSLAPHDISLLLFFCKNFPNEINYAGFQLLKREIHDSSISSFKFPKNIGAHIFVSWLHPFKEHRFVIVGDKGMLSYEDSSKNKEIVFYQKSVDHSCNEYLNDDGKISIEYDKRYPLDAQLEFFIKSISERSINLSNFELSMDVIKILEKLEED